MPPRIRKLTHTLALSALAVALLAAWPMPARRAARAQEEAWPQQELKKEPTCAVYGRALYAETNRPVRRARVTLLSTGGNRTDLGALTNVRGEFRIEGVRAGSYFIAVDSPGLMSPVSFLSITELRAGGLDVGGVRKFFDVVEVNGKDDKDVTVRAHRGAAIGGKVRYADGDPAVGVQVHVMRRSDGRLATFFASMNRASVLNMHTDDRGVYRIAGLPPGEYVVGVSEMVEHGQEGGSSAMESYTSAGVGIYEGLAGQRLLVTYYPSASRAKDATTVSVDAGDEREDVDISIPDRDLHTVAGTVRGKRDRWPLQGAHVNITRKDQDASGDNAAYAAMYTEVLQNSVRTDEQGRWQLKEIPDGLYTISVTPPEEYETEAYAATMSRSMTISNANVTITNANVSVMNMNSGYTPPRRTKKYAPTQREVRVAGGDVTDLPVELNEGSRISGTITVEGGKPLPEYMSIMALRITPNPEEIISGGLQSANVRGGVFTVEGLSTGKFFLHPDRYALEHGGLYLKAINWNGRDILREPLDVGEGESVEGVRVVFSSDPAKIEVRAFTSDRKPAQNVNVFLLPADISKWAVYAPQLHCSTGDGGSCTINAAPGDYVVVTIPMRIAFGEVESEIRKRALTSQRVSLRGVETKTVEVSLTEK